jgi:Ser/Thr protein kinase RdoA (MazF antagonist)
LFDVHDLAAILQRLYGFQQVRCQLIKATIRAVYQVWADAQEYVLYIYRPTPRTRSEIEAELTWIQHVAQHGLATPTPLRTQQDDYLFTLTAPEGERQAVLFPFVSGQPLSKQPDPITAEQCGALIGQLHAIGAPPPLARPLIDFDHLVTNNLRAITAAMPHRNADLHILETSAARLQALWSAIATTDYGLLHGDLIPSNILVAERPTLIDFDFCGYGCRLYDVAVFCYEADYWQMGAAVKSAFLQGYQQTRLLPVVDQYRLHLLQIAHSIFSLGVPATYINTWGKGYFSEAIITKQMQLLAALWATLPA